jgi:hypothetical protein
VECSPYNEPTTRRVAASTLTPHLQVPKEPLQSEISSVTRSDDSVTDSELTTTEPSSVQKKGTADYYCELLLDEFKEVLVDQLPKKLPPLRDINHQIPFHPKTAWIAHE